MSRMLPFWRQASRGFDRCRGWQSGAQQSHNSMAMKASDRSLPVCWYVQVQITSRVHGSTWQLAFVPMRDRLFHVPAMPARAECSSSRVCPIFCLGVMIDYPERTYIQASGWCLPLCLPILFWPVPGFTLLANDALINRSRDGTCVVYSMPILQVLIPNWSKNQYDEDLGFLHREWLIGCGPGTHSLSTWTLWEVYGAWVDILTYPRSSIAAHPSSREAPNLGVEADLHTLMQSGTRLEDSRKRPGT